MLSIGVSIHQNLDKLGHSAQRESKQRVKGARRARTFTGSLRQKDDLEQLLILFKYFGEIVLPCAFVYQHVIGFQSCF